MHIFWWCTEKTAPQITIILTSSSSPEEEASKFDTDDREDTDDRSSSAMTQQILLLPTIAASFFNERRRAAERSLDRLGGWDGCQRSHHAMQLDCNPVFRELCHTKGYKGVSH